MNKALNATKSYVGISFGMLLYAIGVVFFIIPAKFVGGGIAGIATLLFYATGLSTGISVFVLNIGLVLLGIKILGANFGIKTIFGICTLSGWLSLLQYLVNDFKVIDDMLLSALLGGGLCGLGLGIAFDRGGSSGGTDIFAMIVNKYYNVSPGKIILACDVFIIASCWLIFKDLSKVVYGYVTMGILSYVVDAFLTGTKQSIQMFIFSEKYPDIVSFITNKTNRGVTLLDGHGGYTGKDVKVLMTVLRKKEFAPIFRKIKELDPNAFITQCPVMGVYGNGFDKIKH